MPKPSEILNAKTWIKGAYGRLPDGSYNNTYSRHELRDQAKYFEAFCMLGACVKCGLEEGDCIVKMAPIVEKRFNDRYKAYKMSDFNDHEDTTLEDVISVLKEAGL